MQNYWNFILVVATFWHLLCVLWLLLLLLARLMWLWHEIVIVRNLAGSGGYNAVGTSKMLAYIGLSPHPNGVGEIRTSVCMSVRRAWNVWLSHSMRETLGRSAPCCSNRRASDVQHRWRKYRTEGITNMREIGRRRVQSTKFGSTHFTVNLDVFGGTNVVRWRSTKKWVVRLN